MKTVVYLRIVIVAPPAGVSFAVQRGRSDLLAPYSTTPETLVFEFPVTVADAAAQPPRLTGEFTHGPAAGRFIYVNSGTYAGETQSCWSRRAKVPLAGISSILLHSAVESRGTLLEARIAGTGRDGGPVCATVPLLAGWAISSI